ncbi:hypothetical protein AN1V17_34310 [Vallitalea sediminicola]
MKKRDELLSQARYYCNELSNHSVLSKYWSEMSLVLKGSTARGNPDQYSDIDLVFFCDEKVKDKIVKDYYNLGLISRQDGVFMNLPDWIGHYNIETYEKLTEYFRLKDYPEIWEYTNVIVLHDELDRYNKIIDEYNTCIFEDSIIDVKQKYLKLQLTLDWLRHPLKRGDEISVILHCSKIIRLICQLSYLIDEQTYPHDKWLFHYLKQTKFGSQNENRIIRLGKNIISNDLPLQVDKEVDEYSQYALADELITDLKNQIQLKFGNEPWLEEWYFFV